MALLEEWRELAVRKHMKPSRGERKKAHSWEKMQSAPMSVTGSSSKWEWRSVGPLVMSLQVQLFCRKDKVIREGMGAGKKTQTRKYMEATPPLQWCIHWERWCDNQGQTWTAQEKGQQAGTSLQCRGAGHAATCASRLQAFWTMAIPVGQSFARGCMATSGAAAWTRGFYSQVSLAKTKLYRSLYCWFSDFLKGPPVW